MELKKSPKADLQSKKGIFTQIGLIIALLITWGMLNVTKSEVEITIPDVTDVPVEADVIEPVRPEEPPKPNVPRLFAPVVTDIFEVVDNNADLEDEQDIFNAEADENSAVNIYNLPTGVGSADGEIYVPEDDMPFVKVEKMPTFNKRPFQEFNKWVQKEVKYPAIANENGVTGVVVVRFIVDKDGHLKNFENYSPNVDKSLYEAVVAVLKAAPKCEPGEQRGRAVPVYSTVRVVFRTE